MRVRALKSSTRTDVRTVPGRSSFVVVYLVVVAFLAAESSQNFLRVNDSYVRHDELIPSTGVRLHGVPFYGDFNWSDTSLDCSIKLHSTLAGQTVRFGVPLWKTAVSCGTMAGCNELVRG